ncbi:sugar transferase [Sandaracinobacteroides sp. A072]|uniref:sugar transferase n=1 Tax=Sandaracinobacteroides sp. A072 TaxID=3461146 RepID=UPI004040F84D
MKRLFDIVVAGGLLILVLPVLLAAAIGIRVSSPGPIFYRAARVGRGRVHFSMLKFRSMHVSDGGPVITSKGDNRIFPLGVWLRRLKIDELPQLINVVKGDMSLVGPRPEDPKIVAESYAPWMLETLDIRPGITSPGAVFYYAVGEALVDDDDPEGSYVARLLPPKLAVERAYMERATIFSDIHCMLLTAAAILGNAVGRPVLPARRDLLAARRWDPGITIPTDRRA